MRRRWMTLMAASILGAATMVAVPLPAQANWQPWTNLGGDTLYSGPGFVYPDIVFVRNAAGKLILWSGLAPTPPAGWPDASIIGAPAVVAGPGQGPATQWPMEVYFRAPDDHVRYNTAYWMCIRQVCSWTGSAYDAGGAVASAPTATYLQTNRLDLFARGTNGRLAHTWRYGSASDPWAQWEDLGGITFVESPSAVSWWDGNRIDVFVKGVDTHLWHKWWTSTQGWSGWENLGGVLTSAPAAIVWPDGHRLDVFAKGTSDTLIHKWWDASTGWTGWEDLGGRFQYSPAVAMSGNTRIDVYVTGSTAQLEHLWWG